MFKDIIERFFNYYSLYNNFLLKNKIDDKLRKK